MTIFKTASGKIGSSVAFPVPPLAGQRIVACFHELMALCDQLEARLAAADATRPRLLNALAHDVLNGADLAEAA